MIALDLPAPPSTNNLFLNMPGKGRIKSPEYRAWMTEAGWNIASQRKGAETMHAPVAVEIRLRRPRANADLDNRSKAVLDALQNHLVIGNDNLVHDLRIVWDLSVPIGRCLVTVTAIGRQAA